jgi:phytol kinase
MSGLAAWVDAASLLLPRYLLCLLVAICCIRLCVALRASGILSPLIARKSMHALTGPVFCCLWILFPYQTATQRTTAASASQPAVEHQLAAAISPYAAASIPLLSSLYFAAVGCGFVSDRQLVSAVSRSGDRSELLLGPMLYGLVNAASCCLFWLDSPVGIFLILCLCIGDGLADVAGRWSAQHPARFYRPLPWNPNKTAVGSLSMFAASVVAIAAFSLGFVRMLGFFSDRSTSELSVCGLCIAAVGTVVESLPIPELDNLTVFLAGTLTSRLCC